MIPIKYYSFNMDKSEKESKKSFASLWQESKLPTIDKESSTDSVPNTNSRSKVIEHARKFLEKEEVRNQDIKKKATFLEAKGLSKEELEALLGNVPRKNIIPTADKDPLSVKLEDTTQSESKHLEPQIVSIPPIITYPEFLTNPPTEPLLTTNRFLNILYVSTFSTAAVYGVFEYFVSPLVEKLAECRHELFSTTHMKLDILSQKLESVVSEISPIKKLHNRIDNEDSCSEKDDDPAELFHRDIGIQTSPPRSPVIKNSQHTQEQLINQTTSLNSLNMKLKDMVSVLDDESREEKELETNLTDLRKYLNGIAYQISSGSKYENMYMSNGAFGGYSLGNSASGTNVEDDEIVKVKKEVKKMKGLLLSARTFPGVRPGTSTK